jgi:hypothetical protein
LSWRAVAHLRCGHRQEHLLARRRRPARVAASSVASRQRGGVKVRKFACIINMQSVVALETCMLTQSDQIRYVVEKKRARAREVDIIGQRQQCGRTTDAAGDRWCLSPRRVLYRAINVPVALLRRTMGR